jgi:glycosyltransferase involved in cell wall biosynthesis
MSPLVTIITPTYNQRAYLGLAVRSVLDQTMPRWELIVVDDGSDDGTDELMSGFGDPRIQYVRLPHRGLSRLGETYNTALSKARGSLVAILEGDDLWPKDRLARQVPVFDDASVALSWGRGDVVDEDGHVTGHFTGPSDVPGDVRFDCATLFRRMLETNVFAPTVTVMARRDALERVGGFRQSGSGLFVDLPTWLWVLATETRDAMYVDAVLGSWRRHSRQTSQRHSYQLALEHWKVVEAVTSALPTADLDRLGWTRRRARHNAAEELLLRAARSLQERRYSTARQEYGSALGRAGTLRHVRKATVGLLSTIVRVDLSGAVRRWRTRRARRGGAR